VSELHLETFTRERLIGYLVAHVYPRAGERYAAAAGAALKEQTTETLLAMAKTTHAEQLEREEKRRQARQERQ